MAAVTMAKTKYQSINQLLSLLLQTHTCLLTSPLHAHQEQEDNPYQQQNTGYHSANHTPYHSTGRAVIVTCELSWDLHTEYITLRAMVVLWTGNSKGQVKLWNIMNPTICCPCCGTRWNVEVQVNQKPVQYHWSTAPFAETIGNNVELCSPL